MCLVVPNISTINQTYTYEQNMCYHRSKFKVDTLKINISFTQLLSYNVIVIELMALIIITKFRHFIKLIKYVSHRWSVFRLGLDAVSYKSMH